jgi:hypothetical protein
MSTSMRGWLMGMSWCYESWRTNDHLLALSASATRRTIIVVAESRMGVQAMADNDYFSIVLEAMKKKATYSKSLRGWVLSRMQAQLTLLDYVELLQLQLAPAPSLLKEGERMGLWELRADIEVGAPIVVIKDLSGTTVTE